jgi:hypothetical protein
MLAGNQTKSKNQQTELLIWVPLKQIIAISRPQYRHLILGSSETRLW